MTCISRLAKSANSICISFLLATMLGSSSAHADAGLIIISEGSSGGSVKALSADGSIAAGTLITGDDQLFIWNATDGVDPLGYLPNQSYSSAFSMSDFAIRVFGRGEGDSFFTWTKAGGMLEITTSGRLKALSDDGMVSVGHSILNLDPPMEAIKSVGGVTTRLGILSPSDAFQQSLAWDVSSDGGVVVGESTSELTPLFAREAFRWTEADGMVGMGLEVGGVTQRQTIAKLISPTADIIVGTSTSNLIEGNFIYQVFIWTFETGMVSIHSDSLEYEVHGMSADGSVIVGRYLDEDAGRNMPWRWSEASGMQTLYEWLSDAGVDTDGWISGSIYGVSADGYTVGGQVEDIDHNRRPFIAYVNDTVVVQDVIFGGRGGSFEEPEIP